MSYDVYYKKERNGKFTIIVDDEKIKTPLVSESVADSLCEDITDFLDNYNEDDYVFQIYLSDEHDPLGIIIDIWKDEDIDDDLDSDEEPYDTATFLFDDYSSDDYLDDEEDFNYGDSDFDDFDE